MDSGLWLKIWLRAFLAWRRLDAYSGTHTQYILGMNALVRLEPPNVAKYFGFVTT